MTVSINAKTKRIAIDKLTPRIGAEISGLDLANLSDEEFEQIHEALLDNLVIFFRDQPLNREQHIALGRRFGPIKGHSYAASSHPEHPEIYVLEKHGSRRQGEWHADITCEEAPPMGAILAMRELPAGGGGDTSWASMYAAYEGLSPEVRDFVDRLTAIHSGRVFESVDPDKRYPETEHPVVRTHPVTKRKGLFVNPTFTSHIVQLDRNESEHVLSMLYQHIAKPEFHVRFRWSEGAVAMWDNRCTQHHPINDYYPNKRRVERVTMEGDRPF